MDMGSDVPPSSAALTPAGVDFSNETQAFGFLQEILDDSILGAVGNQYARYFWYGVVVVIGVASLCNIVQRSVLRMRLRESARNGSQPAKPTNLLTQSIATAAALLREPSYLQMTPVTASNWVKVPPLGHVYIVAAYFAFILALTFINNNVPGAQHLQALSIRAGWLGAAQVPLLVLTSSKTNLIGFLVNSSVERLNVYHRWFSRGLLLLATLHFGLQSHAWSLYGLMTLEWQTDECPPTGMAAYSLLIWMNLTSLAPLRFFSYKLFVVQHLLAYFGFIIAIVYHLYGTSSPYSTNYIYIGIALYLVGQLIRLVRMAVVNIRPNRATLTPLEGGATKIRISSRQIKSWQAGSYVRLFMPRFNIVQGHPATILSTPTSHGGDLIFILGLCGGFTQRLLEVAQVKKRKSTHLTLIDGPYPSPHADFACFDTLVLIAGSTGVTFTLSILLDIAQRAKMHKALPLRILHFTWVIKRRTGIAWVSEELRTAFEMLQETGIETLCNIHVTCDDVAGESHMASDPDLSFAEVYFERPTFRTLLERHVSQAHGETAVSACGPLGLSVAVRSAVVRVSDDLAVDKGSGLAGIHLHVENFD
ncbi:fre ferric reductase-like transmembrane component [Trichoderma arundinaceum]|uniref:Fre ferric reductase-like transmembrane component n=1 Tax=Trichoderma arundinaceum TaxID=490622 RepID=A0A395NBQ0_TRIAR|nr:fre ferric reductase-like transmembrane component [Trichoderma arundinaceum]